MCICIQLIFKKVPLSFAPVSRLTDKTVLVTKNYVIFKTNRVKLKFCCEM